MDKPKIHLFVCTNFKEKGECCAPKGGKELRDGLKKFVKGHSELKDIVKVTASGCLSHCEDGITAVCYPRGDWFTKLTAESQKDLETYLLKLAQE